EQRHPSHAAVDGLQEAAGGRAHIEDARIGLHGGDVVNTSAHHGRADRAEVQILEYGFIRGLGNRGSGAQRQQQDASNENGGAANGLGGGHGWSPEIRATLYTDPAEAARGMGEPAVKKRESRAPLL